jgi:hypothetical protein
MQAMTRRVLLPLALIGVVLGALAACRDQQTRAKLLSGPSYPVTVHYAPRSLIRDDGTTLSVPPDLADWSGTLVLNGFDQRFRTGLLTLTGKQGAATIRERVRLRPQLERDSFIIEGIGYDLVKLPAQPAGGGYSFHPDDFLFAYDEVSQSWVCRGYKNVDGVEVDAQISTAPAPQHLSK